MSYLRRDSLFLWFLILTLNVACSTDVISSAEEVNSEEILFPLDKTISIENAQVELFLRKADYSSGFSSPSCIRDYAVESGYRMDYPVSYSIAVPNDVSVSLSIYTNESEKCSFAFVNKTSDSYYEITNLVPGVIYYYDAKDVAGNIMYKDSLKVTGNVRMIKMENQKNVRDIGGWQTRNGNSIVYGKIFRGSAFKDISEQEHNIINQLGINTEIDLRSNEELLLNDDNPTNDKNYSLLGGQVNYYHYPMPLSGFYLEDQVYLSVFKTVLEKLTQENVIYIHCAGGADRTGSIMLMLESLLDVSDSEMAKDYELTSFAPLYYDKDNYRTCNKCQKTFNHFADIAGSEGTTCEITTRYMMSLGVTLDEIERFRNIMLKR